MVDSVFGRNFPMGDIAKIKIHYGQLKSGRWVAATGFSPYVCVEADTEQAVKALAVEALTYYEQAIAKREEQPFTRAVTAGELIAA